MVRGAVSDLGSTRLSANRYHYTKTTRGWMLTHHLMAEQMLGRHLKENERVVFKDKDRTNLEAANIEVQEKGKSSARTELARLIARRDELQARIDELETSLDT